MNFSDKLYYVSLGLHFIDVLDDPVVFKLFK